MQIKHRFFIIFSVLAIVPLMLLSHIVYSHYIRLSNIQAMTTSANIMEQAVKQTNSVFANMQHILESIQSYSYNENTILQSLKKFRSQDSAHTDLDIYTANQQLKMVFQNLIYSTENINGIFIFTPSGVTLGQGYGNGVDVRSDYNPADDAWYQSTLELDGKIYIDGVVPHSYLLNDTPSLSFSMCIRDVYTRDFLGVMYINCAPGIFSLDALNVLPETTFFSIERDGSPLYQSGFDLSPPDAAKTITYTEALAIPDVTLTAVFDKSVLASNFSEALYLLAIVIICFSILFVILAYFLARYLTRPIITLSQLMAQPQEQHRIIESPYLNRNDEIGTLYNQYLKMLEENKRYIKTEFENQLILMNSQMRTLESQINAHFLYNTLEAINSLASIEGCDDISTMALALGDMFRYSIKTKGELVTLEDELAHVQNFIAIQLIRFDNAFSFQMDVPKELLNHKVLKLILQPIVENALYHGLLHCNAGSAISLTVRQEDGRLLFSVIDDGVGMDSPILEMLRSSLTEKPDLASLNQAKGSGIGLSNIHSRIRLYYGPPYGITINSEKTKGTSVFIQVPDIPK